MTNQDLVTPFEVVSDEELWIWMVQWGFGTELVENGFESLFGKSKALSPETYQHLFLQKGLRVPILGMIPHPNQNLKTALQLSEDAPCLLVSKTTALSLPIINCPNTLLIGTKEDFGPRPWEISYELHGFIDFAD